MRAVSPSPDRRPGGQGQQAPNAAVLDGVLERVTFCNAETGYTETAGFLLDAWGPREHPAEETVYSCSPHRVQMLGRLVRDDYLPAEGNAVLALLPDWVQRCADQAGLPAALAAPAMEAARAEAATPVTGDHGPGDEDGASALFRRKQL
jgi:hypothetical protein